MVGIVRWVLQKFSVFFAVAADPKGVRRVRPVIETFYLGYNEELGLGGKAAEEPPRTPWIAEMLLPRFPEDPPFLNWCSIQLVTAWAFLQEEASG